MTGAPPSSVTAGVTAVDFWAVTQSQARSAKAENQPINAAREEHRKFIRISTRGSLHQGAVRF
jgi:hypothetical protein